MKFSDIGMVGILLSRKATMALLVLAASTVAVLLKDIDGAAYATIMSVVSGIFFGSHTYQTLQAQKQSDQTDINNQVVANQAVVNQAPPNPADLPAKGVL